MTGICNILCFVTVVTMVTATDYCLLTSCTEKYSHTMCKYPSSTPAIKCGYFYNIGFNDTDIRNIVNIHNDLRQQIASGRETRGRPSPQPPAVKMPYVTWDRELENIAQRWAIQCNYDYDKCRNVDRCVVGQNIGFSISSAEDSSGVQLVKGMYNGVDAFDKNKVSLPYEYDPVTIHYTQMVWANTTKVGCGQIKFQRNGLHVHHVVCNYGPSGNVIGDFIYEVKI
ncbi:PREDICTED: venom allergen 3-like isoform X3 [Vollenhovia emeryi]|uniref:venom allergen 3-like isoform X3 n=1 Tax=Vollenhovia emeryi TaxID=411798 RepID=UPI0005F3C10F|nr:PREDICTED: venom allergen 3-like isoform X3 [Vollenhovia emeryi]